MIDYDRLNNLKEELYNCFDEDRKLDLEYEIAEIEYAIQVINE